MSLSYAVLKRLSDGVFHSGEELAAENRVTRAAIWKAIRALTDQFALDIHSVRGRGYRLASPIELLDKHAIRAQSKYAAEIQGIDTFLTIDSTNAFLMQASHTTHAAPWIVLAEHQAAGRGRRGRYWHSPFAGNIYLSLLWRFVQAPAHIMGLSLALGVVICRYLAGLGVAAVGLKWPNDVLCQGRKLCGILLEMHGESNGPYHVVAGIGLNVLMPDSARSIIDQPYIALGDVLQTPIPRNALAAGLIDALLDGMHDFDNHGLDLFQADWQHYDAYRDRAVSLQLVNRTLSGIARGIDEQGALLVEHDGTVQRYYSGDVSLRKTP